MSDNGQTYEVGDWIVHLTYGVGQIENIEEKPIGGALQKCYHVRTNDGVFWLPVNNEDNERVRPIAGPKRIQRALAALREAPMKMATNFRSRRKRIKQDSLDGDLNSDLTLIRDLNARQFRKGLNNTEQNAFKIIVKRFLQEWSLSKGIEIQEANEMLERYLLESRQKAKEQKETLAA